MDKSFVTVSGININVEVDSKGESHPGVIILIHGLGEHIGRYDEWAARFTEEGYAVVRADLPGHGKSGGKKGHISAYDEYHGVIQKMIKIAGEEFGDIPVILYGHSLGGTIVLDYIISGHKGVNLLIATSPWIDLSFQPSKMKMFMAKVARKIAPSMVQPSGLVTEHISQNPEMVSMYRKDPLVHSRISPALFYSTYTAGKRIAESAEIFDIPVLIEHGTGDKITSHDASRKFAEGSENITLRLWDGGFHELHHEPFREDVFKDISGWLKSKLEK